MTPTSSVRVPTSRVPTTVPTNVLCRASLPASSMYPMCTVPYRLTDNPFHAYIISLCSDRCIISTFSTLSVGSRGKLDCAGRGVQYPGEYYWFLPVSACAFLERRLRRASGGSAPTPPLGLTAPNPIVYVCTPERTTVLRKSLPLKVLPYRKRPLISANPKLIICFQYYLSTVNHVDRPVMAVFGRLLPGGSLGIARGCMIGPTRPFSQGNAVARALGTFWGGGGGGGGGRG